MENPGKAIKFVTLFGPEKGTDKEEIIEQLTIDNVVRDEKVNVKT